MNNKKSITISRTTILILSIVLLFHFSFSQKIFKRGNGSEPASLDPHFASGDWENNIIGDMFMGLMTETADGKLIPGLAEKYSISKDGTTYTFTLRAAKWSDGRAITANDFVYSFRRILNPKTAAKYAFILYSIKNAKAVNEGKAKVSTIGVRAQNNKVLEIKLETSTPYFLEMLTHYTSWAIPQHVVEKYGAEWTKPENIVVSGAFILEEWRVQDVIKLKKNPQFFDAKNVKLDGVEFYPIEDANAELNRFRTGDLHYTKDIPLGQFDRLKKEFGKKFIVYPLLGLYYYSLNTNDPKLKDVNIRKALSLAVNREVITEKITKEGQQPAYGIIPPSVNNYVTPQAQPQLEFKTWTPSKRIAEAQKIMRVAGYSKSKPLKLVLKYNTSGDHKKIAVAIASMWKQIYVKTELFNQETKVHYENLQNNNFEVGRAGWLGDYNDPTTFTDLFLDNDYNYSRLVNPTVARLSERAAKAIDLSKRAKILAQMEGEILDDYSIIPIYYYVYSTLLSSQVQGWANNIKDTHRSRWISLR